jgi:ParB family chromosome partitioning protein
VTRKRLGRGLDGLLPATPAALESLSGNTAAIEELHPARSQPRTRFDPESLSELAASIREHGVLEPIVVRERELGGFEIIAGERRWRAAQQAGLKEVPIFVLELSDQSAFEAALVENLQREDLNPIETAKAFQRLIEEFGYTQETIAAKVGKERSTVSNALRLLRLPPEVTDLLEAGDLSEGHGRALLAAPDVGTMRKLARAAASQRWSVRETERQVKLATRGNGPSDTNTAHKAKSANVLDLENRLSRAVGATAKIHEKSKGRGELRISFSSYEELDRIIAELTN